jgi:hypothetical protein
VNAIGTALQKLTTELSNRSAKKPPESKTDYNKIILYGGIGAVVLVGAIALFYQSKKS